MNYNLIIGIVIVILLLFSFCRNNIEKFTTCESIKGECSSNLCPSNCKITKDGDKCSCLPKD